jgi:trans-AT polyketide synthase/acyltransferase/oxidoreductase domain-containing protein
MTPPFRIRPEHLGSSAFIADHGVKLAYLCGAMYKGISSPAMVIALGRAGLMGFFGAGGLAPEKIEAALVEIKIALHSSGAFGMNLLGGGEVGLEAHTVDLYRRHEVRCIEAAAYIKVTPNLVRYRLAGATRDAAGRIATPNRIIAKVSRPEIARQFLSPPPPEMVAALREQGALTASEAALAPFVPLAQDVCVEADSGGHTDQGVAFALLPAIMTLRDDLQVAHAYGHPVRVGAAGGIGTPEAVAAAFMLGADFILTGSINQCTVEADTSDVAKDMLSGINVQDTAYAPAGDMFELGAKVQVLKKGVLFHARANKLYELYTRHASLEDIDRKTLDQIEIQYFKRPIAAVWDETVTYLQRKGGSVDLERQLTPKQRLALVFKWYFVQSTRLAMAGDDARRADFQIQCGPAMGAFNQWTKDGPLAHWRDRRVAEIGHLLMAQAAELFQRRLVKFSGA